MQISMPMFECPYQCESHNNETIRQIVHTKFLKINIFNIGISITLYSKIKVINTIENSKIL